MGLLDELKSKADIDGLVAEMLTRPERMPWLLEFLHSGQGAARFHAEKVLRRMSEQQPGFLYTWFAEVAGLIGSPNKFILWGAVTTLANLVPFDHDHLFDAYYEPYFSLLNSDSMVTAGNIIKNAPVIIKALPDCEPDITHRLIFAASHVYRYKNEPSPECGNIIIGGVIDAFSQYWDMSECQEAMLAFATAQTGNSRSSTARKVRLFLGRHILVAADQKV